jgi:hypothetical protein
MQCSILRALEVIELKKYGASGDTIYICNIFQIEGIT